MPAQIVFPGFAEILMDGVTFGFTVITMGLEVAGLPVTQDAFEIISHKITSPLLKAEVVNIELFVARSEVPFFH